MIYTTRHGREGGGFRKSLVCLELGIADTLGRPTLLIGKQGTERELESRFPSLAKRRCHPYPKEIYQQPAQGAGLAQAVESFLSRS